MSKQFIYFTGILVLLMAATMAVPAQQGMAGLNDTSLNNTTLNASQNLTSFNASSSDALINRTITDLALNETSPESALINSNATANVTLPGNATATIELAGNVTDNAVSMPQVATADDREDTAFPIGSGRQSEKIFVVNGNARELGTFTVGLPIKPVRDVGKMMFVCDIV